MLTGTCHCGASGWTLEGDPGVVTACNCSLCSRYGVLWAYDYEDERIQLCGPSQSYVRANISDRKIEILSCPTCANVLAGAASMQTTRVAGAPRSTLHQPRRSPISQSSTSTV